MFSGLLLFLAFCFASVDGGHYKISIYWKSRWYKPPSALLPPPRPPKTRNDRATKCTTDVVFCNSASCINSFSLFLYSFTPMKSNTHSMWESFIILESKYPLKYLHFTVKRIAKHKVMYKLRYSSFWSMENGGRNEFTTTNHNFQEFRLKMLSY